MDILEKGKFQKNYHPPYIVSKKIRVHFEVSEYTIRAVDYQTTSK